MGSSFLNLLPTLIFDIYMAILGLTASKIGKFLIAYVSNILEFGHEIAFEKGLTVSISTLS